MAQIGGDPEHSPDPLHADREHDEQQDRVVVREAIAELEPAAVLVEQVHHQRTERGDAPAAHVR